MTEPAVPLARLMAFAYRQLIDALHDRLRARGWHDVRPTFGYVLLAVRDQPRGPTELAAIMGTSKQAASKLVTAIADAGYVRLRPSPDDARSRLVELTDRGRQLLAVVEEIYVELEADWAALVGPARLDTVRDALTVILHSTGTDRSSLLPRPPANRTPDPPSR